MPAVCGSQARASTKAIPSSLQSLSLTPVTQVSDGGLPARVKPPCLASWLRGVSPTGYGGLSLSIEGPSKVDINTEDLEDGTCRVTYCPTEPGNYIINIKFADQHVPGECSAQSPLSLYHNPPCCAPGLECNLCGAWAVLSFCRQPLLCEGDRRGPGEREHHAQATGPFGGQRWQSL